MAALPGRWRAMRQLDGVSVVPADANDRLYGGPVPSSVAKQAHQKVQGDLAPALGTLTSPPAMSLIQLEPHIGQVARYIDGFFGFDQWFLFDSRWAVAHPHLARSLLRYAAHWDPYEAGR